MYLNTRDDGPASSPRRYGSPPRYPTDIANYPYGQFHSESLDDSKKYRRPPVKRPPGAQKRPPGAQRRPQGETGAPTEEAEEKEAPNEAQAEGEAEVPNDENASTNKAENEEKTEDKTDVAAEKKRPRRRGKRPQNSSVSEEGSENTEPLQVEEINKPPSRAPSQPAFLSKAPSLPRIPSKNPSQPNIPTRVPSQPAVPSKAPSQPRIPSRAPSQPRIPSRAPSQQAIPSKAPSQQRITSRAPSQPTIPSKAPSQTGTPKMQSQRPSQMALENTPPTQQKSNSSVRPASSQQRNGSDGSVGEGKSYNPPGVVIFQLAARFACFGGIRVTGGVRVLMDAPNKKGYVQLISPMCQPFITHVINAMSFLNSSSAAGVAWSALVWNPNQDEEKEDGGGGKVDSAQVVFCEPAQAHRCRAVLETVKAAFTEGDGVLVTPNVPPCPRYNPCTPYAACCPPPPSCDPCCPPPCDPYCPPCDPCFTPLCPPNTCPPNYCDPCNPCAPRPTPCINSSGFPEYPPPMSCPPPWNPCFAPLTPSCCPTPCPPSSCPSSCPPCNPCMPPAPFCSSGGPGSNGGGPCDPFSCQPASCNNCCDDEDPYAYTNAYGKTLFCQLACLVKLGRGEKWDNMNRGQLLVIQEPNCMGYSLVHLSEQQVVLSVQKLSRKTEFKPAPQTQHGFSYTSVTNTERGSVHENFLVSFQSKKHADQFQCITSNCKRVMMMTAAANGLDTSNSNVRSFTANGLDTSNSNVRSFTAKGLDTSNSNRRSFTAKDLDTSISNVRSFEPMVPVPYGTADSFEEDGRFFNIGVGALARCATPGFEGRSGGVPVMN